MSDQEIFRNALIMNSKKTDSKIKALKELIEIGKKNNMPILLRKIISIVRKDNELARNLEKFLTPDMMYDSGEEDVLLFNSLIRMEYKDIRNNSNKIKEQAYSYYQRGGFEEYYHIFSKLIKNLPDITDSEMNDFVQKYCIASLFAKNTENAIKDIVSIRSQYKKYDLNIYVFLLYLINGNFEEAASTVPYIGQNVYDEFTDLVKEEDITFYFTVALLTSFRRNSVKETQVNSNSLVYLLFDEYPEYRALLESYSQCQYELICEEFIKYRERMEKDPVLEQHLHKINYSIKMNIIREILNGANVVPIKYLKDVIKEDESLIENWILVEISNGLKVKIDDIDKTVISYSNDSLNNLLSKTVKFSQRTVNSAFIKILSSYLPETVVFNPKNLNKYKISNYDLRRHERGGMQMGMGLGNKFY